MDAYQGKVLDSRTVSLEYVTDVGGTVLSGSWTATVDGIGIQTVVYNTTATAGYWYIDDTSFGLVGRLSDDTSVGLGNTTIIPIQKNHVYRTYSSNSIAEAYLFIYKFKIS